MEDNGGELAQRVETRCRQLGSLLRERRETLCSLEADHDQAGSVVPREFEGTSETNGCTRSLGGMETPGAREVARIPSVSVPVCVVASVPKCVPSSTPCVEETLCVRKTACVEETTCVSSMACVSEQPGVSEARCVRGTACV